MRVLSGDRKKSGSRGKSWIGWRWECMELMSCLRGKLWMRWTRCRKLMSWKRETEEVIEVAIVVDVEEVDAAKEREIMDEIGVGTKRLSLRLKLWAISYLRMTSRTPYIP